MTDVINRSPLRVRDGGEAGPYLQVPLKQLASIREVLDRGGIRYWVDLEAISLDGKPPVIAINCSKIVNRADVQRLLDEVP